MIITKRSVISGIEHTRDIDITEEQLLRIKSELIQNVVPHLSIEDREFLITGITQEEWDETFKFEEDER